MRELCKLAPKWAAIRSKQIELSELKEALLAESRPLVEQLSLSGAFSSLQLANEAAAKAIAASSSLAKPIEASPQAAALLGPLTPAPRAPDPPFRPWTSPDCARADEIIGELAAIDEALALLGAPMPGKRRSEVEDLYLAGCEKYCESLEPEFHAVVARFCAAVVELGKAKAEYNGFVEGRLRGIVWDVAAPDRLLAASR
jgi:hypothetical protein